MRHAHIFLSIAITILILSGCNSNETKAVVEDTNEITEKEESSAENQENDGEEDFEKLINQLKNYEIVVLEDTDENHRIKVEYPKFNYEPLDEILSDKQAEFEGQLEQAEIYRSEGIEDVFSYQSNVEDVIITENIVSIYFEGRFYQGGGFSFSDTLNYDLKNDRVIELDDVLKEHSISLEEMAGLVAEKLITDERFVEIHEYPEELRGEVEEETKPIESNYSSFTLTEESITFYKQYYSLFPNAEGIIDIEITWDEVKGYQDSNGEKSESAQTHWRYQFGDVVEAEHALKYVDEEYRFSVDLPSSWKGKYFVQISDDYFEHLPKEPSKSIVFNMVDHDKYMGFLFSIEVLEGITEDEVKEYYKDWPGFEGYIGAGNDVVLVYTRPGGMEAALYEDPYIEVGKELSKMVEEDMPNILETLEFN